ncbi:MAG: hypothetical protein RIR32_715 [Verrucomicrobiota bacterium]|jgi:hypothetical protein
MGTNYAPALPADNPGVQASFGELAVPPDEAG